MEGSPTRAPIPEPQTTPEAKVRDIEALSVSDKVKEKAAERARQAALRAAKKVREENQTFLSPIGDSKRSWTRDIELPSPGRHDTGTGAADSFASPGSDFKPHDEDEQDPGYSSLLPPSPLLPDTCSLLDHSGHDKTEVSTHITKHKYPELTEIHGRSRADYIATHGRRLALLWDDFYANDGYKGSFDFVMPRDADEDAQPSGC